MTQHSASTLRFVMRRSTWLALLCAPPPRRRPALNRAYAADAAPAPQTEFGGQCAEGLAEGQHVATDLQEHLDRQGRQRSIASAVTPAKKTFLANPAENLQRARDFMGREQRRVHGKGHAGFHRFRCRNLGQRIHSPTRSKRTMGFSPSTTRSMASHLKLSYDDVDFTRTIDGYGFFPDVKFHDSQMHRKIPDRFLGHTGERQAASPGNRITRNR